MNIFEMTEAEQFYCILKNLGFIEKLPNFWKII